MSIATDVRRTAQQRQSGAGHGAAVIGNGMVLIRRAAQRIGMAVNGNAKDWQGTDTHGNGIVLIEQESSGKAQSYADMRRWSDEMPSEDWL